MFWHYSTTKIRPSRLPSGGYFKVLHIEYFNSLYGQIKGHLQTKIQQKFIYLK